MKLRAQAGTVTLDHPGSFPLQSPGGRRPLEEDVDADLNPGPPRQDAVAIDRDRPAPSDL